MLSKNRLTFLQDYISNHFDNCSNGMFPKFRMLCVMNDKILKEY